jgi:16S rRNA (cytosine967-C5)-methyltransferase
VLFRSIPAVTVRVNSLKPAGELPNSRPHPWLEGYRLLEGFGNIASSEAYKNGLITVQDAAAALPVIAAAPKAGQRLLDACAAPGGKSFLAAQLMGNEGEILACDINSGRLSRVREGAERLGLDIIETKLMDAASFDNMYRERFDIVLADVPCSGFGIIRKKPEIRYKKLDGLAELPGLQYRILSNISGYVRPGGTLVYSTCTLIEAENEAVAGRFLMEHPDFALEAFDLPEPVGHAEGMMTLWPYQYGTDGFFICKMRKK